MNENYNHKIKVPIFSSEIIETEPGNLFEKPNFESMINYLKNKVEKFNEDKPVIKQNKTSKVKETLISAIDCIDSNFEGVPTLLLKITAFNTNLVDGFVEIEEKVNIERKHKFGSETNYLLAYPQIFGNDPSKFKYQWKFFVYDDPTKESNEIISISKLVCKKILNINIRNLKLESILKEIREHKLLENIEIQLSSHSSEIDNPEVKLKDYIITSKVSKVVKNSYQNVPTEKFIELINEREKYFKRILKIFKNNKELRITQEQKNNFSKLSQTIEEIFNSEIEFSNDDLEKLFEKEFIEINLYSVVKEFIKQTN